MQKLITIISFVIACFTTATPAAAISCSLSMTSINFGSVNVLSGAAAYTTGAGTITCSGASKNTSYVFCTNITAGANASGNQRRMISGTNTLNFDLYQNSAHTTEWGNYTSGYLGGGNQSSFTSSGSGTISGTVTVYAALDGSQQTAIPGSYSETMSGSSSNELQYGSKTGTCPTGSSTSQYSFTVSATLVTGCNVNATNLNFGSIGTLTSAVNATSTVTASCTSTTPYNIGLNAGIGSGATVTKRLMTSGTTTLSYALYSNAAMTTIWGNTVERIQSRRPAAVRRRIIRSMDRCRRRPPGPATYSDTITVTVSY